MPAKTKKKKTHTQRHNAGKIEKNGKKQSGGHVTSEIKTVSVRRTKEKQRRYSGAEISMRPACQKQAGIMVLWRVCTFYEGYSVIFG